jgi:hypothetical protein
VLRAHLGDLLLRRGPPGQCLAGQVLPALRQRRLGLVLQVIDRVLQLLLLQLEPLLRGGDIDERAPDLGDVVQHLLVGVVEHLIRVLGRVECLVRFCGDDVVCPLEETHAIAPCNGGRSQALRSRDYRAF